jgi:hypothetical protein
LVAEFMVAERAPLLYGEGVNVSLSQVIICLFVTSYPCEHAVRVHCFWGIHIYQRHLEDSTWWVRDQLEPPSHQ